MKTKDPAFITDAKYRQVSTCANCSFCEDLGVDEICLYCIRLNGYGRDNVNCDCVCIYHEPDTLK